MSFGRGSSSVRIRGREREVEFVVEVEGVPRFVVLPPWGFFESFFGIRSIDEKGAIGKLCSIFEAVRKAKNSRRKKLFQVQKKRQTSFKVGGGAKCLRCDCPSERPGRPWWGARKEYVPAWLVLLWRVPAHPHRTR